MRMFYGAMNLRFLAPSPLLWAVFSCAAFDVSNFGTVQSTDARIAFVIVTGSSGRTYFPVDAAIAGNIGHPSHASIAKRRQAWRSRATAAYTIPESISPFAARPQSAIAGSANIRSA